MVTISFPGLGIENFTVNPVAFTIPIFGGLEVRWYGLIITLGIALAFLYCAYRAKQEGIVFDDLLDIAIFTIIFAVLGARAYYVLTSLDKYDSLYDVIAIWEGGIAIYGAIIAGPITIFVTCRYKKISALRMLDATAPAVMIGQILGRWGNFFNGEAYGSAVLEGSPLYFIRMGLLPNVKSSTHMYYFHPTFLYESLWNLLGFALIHFLYKKKRFDGQVVLMYLSWYGFGRMFIEGLRTDSLYVGVFRISQVVGFACFVIGSILLTVNLVKARRAVLTAQDYEPTYGKISGMKATAPVEEPPAESESTEMEEEQAENKPQEPPTATAQEKDFLEKRLEDLLNREKSDQNKDKNK